MGILETYATMMNISGNFDLQSPAYQLFSFANLLAAIFLARNMKKPKK